MRAITGFVYVVMAVWLLLAAALRIVLLLNAGLPLDPLPFISGALGLIALTLAAPALEERRQHREHNGRNGSSRSSTTLDGRYEGPAGR